MNVGMTLVEVSQPMSKAVLACVVRDAKEATPNGRQLCVTFPLPDSWSESMPYEAIITNEILGRPSERREPHEWVFSGNLCVRRCRVKRGERDVVGEVGVLMFRRSGDMAYTKRSEVDESTIQKATLDSLHPVFTRDVANNVWHLPDTRYVTRLRNRLQALFTWPGESTLLFDVAGIKILRWKPLLLDADLVGVPTKREYDWVAQALLGHPRNSGEAVL